MRRSISIKLFDVVLAVVVIVNVAPVAVTLESSHEDCAGKPAHETEKLSLAKFDKDKSVDPLLPGAEIIMVVGFAVTVGVGCCCTTLSVANPDSIPPHVRA